MLGPYWGRGIEGVSNWQKFLWLKSAGKGQGNGEKEEDLEVLSMYEHRWSLGSVVRSWR